MPVTKTAKRALRSSKKKESINKLIISKLEFAIRLARKTMKVADITKAMSLADIASKKRIIHKNKSARVKSQLSKLGRKTSSTSPKKVAKKSSSKKK